MTSLEGAPPLLDGTPAVEDETPGAVTGRRHVPEDEPFFAGHFPGTPVVPGVFMVEALAECARRSLPSGATLAAAPLVKFRRRVGPGETVEFRVTPASPEGDLQRFDAVASVEGQTAVQATLLFRVEAGAAER